MSPQSLAIVYVFITLHTCVLHKVYALVWFKTFYVYVGAITAI